MKNFGIHFWRDPMPKPDSQTTMMSNYKTTGLIGRSSYRHRRGRMLFCLRFRGAAADEMSEGRESLDVIAHDLQDRQ